MAVDPRAKAIVMKALGQGMDYSDIAGICKVSELTVKRWVSTNRADSKKIQPLIKTLGHVMLTAKDIGASLIEIYKRRKKRFRFNRSHMKKLAGQPLSHRLFADLQEYLSRKGYLLLEFWEDDDETSFFILIRTRQLKKYVKGWISDQEVDEFWMKDDEGFEEEE
jgi:hypothetical protein